MKLVLTIPSWRTLFKRFKSGFSLIELMIAVSIIGILASVTVSDINSTRAKARNATRQATVGTYRTSMELWASTHGGSYFVYYGNPCVTGFDESLSAVNKYALYGTDANNCVGYYTESSSSQGGGGEARMTRRGGVGGVPGYSVHSIADGLVKGGVLNTVTTDPLVSSFTDNSSKSNDFILTLCAADGTEPTDPKLAKYFTIYAAQEGYVDPIVQNRANSACGASQSKHPRFTIQ